MIRIAVILLVSGVLFFSAKDVWINNANAHDSAECECAPELVPLAPLIESGRLDILNEKDHTNLGYTMERCAALFGMQFKIFESSRPQMAQTLRQAYEKLAHTAVKIITISNNTPPHEMTTLMDAVATRIISMCKLYMAEMDKNYIATGSYFGDNPLTKGDTEVCGLMLKQVPDLE